MRQIWEALLSPHEDQSFRLAAPALVVSMLAVLGCGCGAGFAFSQGHLLGFVAGCGLGSLGLAFQFWVMTLTGWRFATRWDLFAWEFFLCRSERPGTFLMHQALTLIGAGLLLWLAVYGMTTGSVPFVDALPSSR